MTSPAVELLNVSKNYGSDQAVNDLNLTLEAKKILALVGPSGCGKTTTLRLIAGFEQPNEGTIDLAGKTVSTAYKSRPPEERGIGVVFQDYALFPHLTAQENVAFGLRNPKDKESKAQALIDAWASKNP